MQQTDNKSAKQTLNQFCSSEGTGEVLERLRSCPEHDYSMLVPQTFYLIWTTPNFRRQVALIDSILDSTSELFHTMLLKYAIKHFSAISTDRRDKFYYLIKKTFNKLSFREITEIENLEIQKYVWKIIDSDRTVVSDWNDELFLKFLSNAKPFVAAIINNIRIGEEKVGKYIDLPINSKNREALYRLFK